MEIHISTTNPNTGIEEIREALLNLVEADKPFSITLLSEPGEPAIHGNAFETGKMPKIERTYLTGINTKREAVTFALKDIRDVDEKAPDSEPDLIHQAVPTGTESNLMY